jgi:hypothetical protein
MHSGRGSGLVAPSSLAVIPVLSCNGFDDVVSMCSHVLRLFYMLSCNGQVYFICCRVMDLMLF